MYTKPFDSVNTFIPYLWCSSLVQLKLVHAFMLGAITFNRDGCCYCSCFYDNRDRPSEEQTYLWKLSPRDKKKHIPLKCIYKFG